jgi:hypothetical protein
MLCKHFSILVIHVAYANPKVSIGKLPDACTLGLLQAKKYWWGLVKSIFVMILILVCTKPHLVGQQMVFVY